MLDEEIENNYVMYSHLKDLKHICSCDCNDISIMEELAKKNIPYKDLGRLYPSIYNSIICDLAYKYASFVYPIIELLFDHIHTYTDDDIHMYPRIFRQACIYGRLPLLKKLLQETRISADVRGDYIQSYIAYSFWKDFCRYATREIELARIEIANLLFDMYPSTMNWMNMSTWDACKVLREKHMDIAASYMILFKRMTHITEDIDSYDKMFICACDKSNSINVFIEMCCKRNPYKYTVIKNSGEILESVANATTSNRILPMLTRKSKNTYGLIYGVIRSFANEMWERKRLVLYQLHYGNRNQNIPIEVIRNIFSYV